MVVKNLTIGSRLRELRRLHGLKLREISKQTGLSVSYISDIERGRTMPSLETCGKLAGVYGVNLSILFRGVEI